MKITKLSNCRIVKEYSNGSKIYFMNGEIHRGDGPAKDYSNGNKWFLQYGCLHRLGHPAVELNNGVKLYYQKGWKHRPDGPAVILPWGYWTKEWWIWNKQVPCKTQEEFEKMMKLTAFW